MKYKRLFLWLMLLMGAVSTHAQEAYFSVEVLDPLLSEVTFYYDNKRAQRQNCHLVTNNGSPLFNSSVFSQRQREISITFDSSFANYRPTNTSYWFSYTFTDSGFASFTGWENLNTSQVTNMSHMFDGLTVLAFKELDGTSFDLSHFDTSKVTDMSYMFRNMSSRASEGNYLDLSSFTFKSGVTATKIVGIWGISLILPATANNLPNDAFADFSCENLTFSSGLYPTGAVQYTGYYTWKGGRFSGYIPGDPTGGRVHAYFSVVIVDQETSVVTFYYDNKRAQRQNTITVTENGSPLFNENVFCQAQSDIFVTFDSSFANYRPTNTSRWFSYTLAEGGSVTFTGWTNLNTSQVTNMSYMFDGLTVRDDADYPFDLTHFNTANVTNMLHMLANMKEWSGMGLSIDLSSFTFNSGANTTGLLKSTFLRNLRLPATANNLASDAFSGVSSTEYPTELLCPAGFTPQGATQYNGYIKWKGGYFKILYPEPYAFLSSDKKKLTFYYDYSRSTRTGGTIYDLNTTGGPGWYSANSTITSVVFDASFVDARPTSCLSWFREMTELTSITGLSYLNTSNVTTMAGMFFRCYKLTNLNLSGFNTANVSDMSYMFYQSYVKNLNLSGFSTANVTNMKSMFDGCYKLENLDLSGFKTGNVTDMSYMFNGCSSLKNLDVSGFNTGNVTTMSYMFSGCSSLEKLDVRGLTFNSSVSTGYMLRNCTSLRTLVIPSSANKLKSTACSGVGTQAAPCTLAYPDGFTPEKTSTGSGWYQWKGGYFKDAETEAYAVLNGSTLTFYFDEEKATRTGTTYELNTGTTSPGWYSKRTSVTTVEFDASFADARPTSCYSWFANMYNLTTITGIGNLKTDAVTDMAGMFHKCFSLTSLDLSNFTFNCTSDKTLDFLYNCSGLQTLTIPASAGNLNAEACTGVGSESAPCVLAYPDGFTPEKTSTGSDWYQWKGGYFKDAETEAYYVVTTVGSVAEVTFYYDDQRLRRPGTSYLVPTNGGKLLIDDNNSCFAKVITFDSSFADYRPTNTSLWFSDLNYGYRATPGEGRILFSGLENLNTSEVTDMSYMFYGMDLAEGLDLSHFDTSKVTDMRYMLAGLDEGLPSGLDLSGFTFNPGCVTTGLMSETHVNQITLPSTANNLAADAFSGVGNMDNGCPPAILTCPSGFTPSGAVQHSGYFTWKGGNFKLSSDTGKEAYYVVMPFFLHGLPIQDIYVPDLLLQLEVTFYYDNQRSSRQGVSYLVPTNGGKLNIDVYNLFEDKFITFDSSFADYRPTSTREWFRAVNYYMETEETYKAFGSVNFHGLENLNTSEVTDMSFMFYDMDWADGFDLSHFDTRKVTDMSYMLATIDEDWLSIDLSGFTINPGTVTDGLMMATHANEITIPATANNLASDAFSGVGHVNEPIPLINPSGIIIMGVEEQHDDYFKWKGGYFKEGAKPYAELNGSTLTFYFDEEKSSRTGTTYELNTGTTSPRWYSNSNPTSVTTVVFDASFADARPTSCHNWFRGMTNLTTITGIGNLKTDEVISMAWMFKGCSGLTSLDVSGFSTTKVKYMAEMFSECSGLTSLNVSGFDTGSVTSMMGMFADCSKLTSLDVGGFITGNVTDMSYMFFDCFKLTSLDVSGFNTANVKIMDYMFHACSRLTSLDVSGFSTGSETSMVGMFYDCSGLTSLDLSNFTFNCTSDKTLDFLYNCSGLQTLTIPASAGNLNAEACTGVGTESAPCMLVYPAGFTPEKDSEGDGWYMWKSGYFKDNTPDPYAVLDGSTLTFYYDRYKSFCTGTVYELKEGRTMPGWYSNRTSVTSVVFDASFAGARPTSCYSWFSDMTKLATITGIGNLKTDEVTDMGQMFRNCKALTSLDVSGFITGNVTDMSCMFYDCFNLKSLDVSEFKTANVTNMSYMFYGCSGLNSLDVSGFNTAKVTDMQCMFYYCYSLKRLDLSSFTFNFESSSTASKDFLYMCGRLQTLIIPATAGNLHAEACICVGTVLAPCTLVYPVGFTPEKTSEEDGEYRWKGGYFKDNILLGDANGDKDVTVADAVAVVNYAVKGERPDWFAFQNADIDGNKEISVNDLTGIVNLVLGTSSSAPSNVLFSYTDAVALTGSGNELTLHLNESAGYTATQMVLTLPEDCRLTDARMFTARGNGHRVVTRSLGDGRYLLVVYSATGKPFNHSGSGLLRLQVSGAHHGDVGVSGIQMVDADVQTVVLDDAYGIATGLDWVSADDGETDGDWYSTQGIRVKTPQRGVYIRNGQKVARKK